MEKWKFISRRHRPYTGDKICSGYCQRNVIPPVKYFLVQLKINCIHIPAHWISQYFAIISAQNMLSLMRTSAPKFLLPIRNFHFRKLVASIPQLGWRQKVCIFVNIATDVPFYWSIATFTWIFEHKSGRHVELWDLTLGIKYSRGYNQFKWWINLQVPFSELSPMEAGMKIALEGLRITIPPGISRNMVRMINICLNEDPGRRPNFDQIIPILEKMGE